MKNQAPITPSRVPIKPYEINVSESELDELKTRLHLSRWPDQVDQAEWNYGTNLDYLKEVVDYWKTDFDWRRQESEINRLHHFSASIGNVDIHFIHEQGENTNATPIVLLHGWPGSFFQMQKIVPMLSEPSKHGGKAGDSFDVVVVSLPGFGFSSKPTEPGMNFYKMAEIVNTLMVDVLGYSKYVVRGSDVGAAIATELAQSFPAHVISIHLSGSNPFIVQLPINLSEAEISFVEKSSQYVMQEGAYGMEQSTKPQTLAFGLNDSPIGLAAWLLEKFRSWSDCQGNLENRFTKDEFLTNVMIYWLTQTIGSSMRVYYESAHHLSPNIGKRVEVPTAMFMFTHDVALAPREWEERTYNVQRWTECTSGGHFAEWEEPGEVANDLRLFFNDL